MVLRPGHAPRFALHGHAGRAYQRRRAAGPHHVRGDLHGRGIQDLRPAQHRPLRRHQVDARGRVPGVGRAEPAGDHTVHLDIQQLRRQLRDDPPALRGVCGPDHGAPPPLPGAELRPLHRARGPGPVRHQLLHRDVQPAGAVRGAPDILHHALPLRLRGGAPEAAGRSGQEACPPRALLPAGPRGTGRRLLHQEEPAGHSARACSPRWRSTSSAARRSTRAT